MKIQNFTFGRNWFNFISKYFDREVLEGAALSLQKFTGLNNFKKLSFADVGCGSGLFSLAAYKLGATKITSFDIDQDSVKACTRLKKELALAADWQVKRGSILNDKFVKKLGRYDLVYSWGVLHHTGKMWEAIENTLRLVAPGGLFYLAIYNRADSWGMYPDGRFGTSVFWQKFKHFFYQSPALVQKIIELLVSAALVILYLLAFRNPFGEIKTHSIKFRGMSWRTDIRDWLGGYPYEYASVEEIFNFVHKRGFTLENLKSNNGLMNNEYLFRRK